MRITREETEKRYANMSDEDLTSTNREQLSDLGRMCYDAELARRASPEYEQQKRKAARDAEIREIEEAKRCFFCGVQPVSPMNAARVLMYSDQNRQQAYRQVKHTWQEHVVLISRCENCQRIHRTESNLRVVAGVIAFPLLLIFSMVALAFTQAFGFILIPVVAVVLLTTGSSFASFLMYRFPRNRITKPLSYAYESTLVRHHVAEGWGKGEPFTHFWALGQIVRKSLGLVEARSVGQRQARRV